MEKSEKTTPETAVSNVLPKSDSERFTNMIVNEFSTNAGGGLVALTAFQKRLVQNYFITIDKTLKKAESTRMATKEEYRDQLAFEWKNVNMAQLAVDVVACARVGLDPAQPNHINMIPYKNKTTGKFDIGFLVGYRGSELKARKYGIEMPDDVIIELVYSTDKFQELKKSYCNRVENYVFEITNPFERGEVIGGFYYFVWFDNPEKNKLRVFSKAQIDKRKPKYAAAEFWGGEKDKWVKDEKSGKNVKEGKEAIEGWYDEMAYKTIARAAYNSITIDSQKIDDDYMKLMSHERESDIESQITAPAKTETKMLDIPVTHHEDVTDQTMQPAKKEVPTNPEPTTTRRKATF